MPDSETGDQARIADQARRIAVLENQMSTMTENFIEFRATQQAHNGFVESNLETVRSDTGAINKQLVELNRSLNARTTYDLMPDATDHGHPVRVASPQPSHSPDRSFFAKLNDAPIQFWIFLTVAVLGMSGVLTYEVVGPVLRAIILPTTAVPGAE